MPGKIPIHEKDSIRRGHIGEEEGKTLGRLGGKTMCGARNDEENLSIPCLKPTVKAAGAQDRGTETPCAV